MKKISFDGLETFVNIDPITLLVCIRVYSSETSNRSFNHFKATSIGTSTPLSITFTRISVME